MSASHPAEASPADPLSEPISERASEPGPISEPGPESRSSALRHRILAAATALFGQRGFAATSMREVAEAIGCTKPALYYHFASKSALFLEVIHNENRRIGELLAEHIHGEGSVRQRMHNAMHAYFGYARENPTALALLLRAELHRESGQPDYDFRSSRQLYLRAVGELIEQAVAAGEIRAGVDIPTAVMVLAGAVDECVMRWLLEREPIPDDYPERVLALLFGGLAP